MCGRGQALTHPDLLIDEVEILRSGLLAVRVLRRGHRLQTVTRLLLAPLPRSAERVPRRASVGQLRLQWLDLCCVRHASLLVRSF